MAMILLADYAAKVGRSTSAVYDKIQRGYLPTAVKVGRQWFVDADAPYSDQRIRSGAYVGVHRRRKSNEKSPEP